MSIADSDILKTEKGADQTEGGSKARITLLGLRSWLQDNLTSTTDVAAVGAVAAGSTLGLEQSLLANAGQPALTVLVVGPATNGKVQGTSLGDNNVVEVYANGSDFSAGIVLYREFMGLGEPICFTGLEFGAIISASKGFYGFSEVEGDSAAAARQGLMPLMSFGFAFKSTFLYAFRNSTGTNGSRGIVFVANGPLTNTIKMTNGSGAVTLGQEGIVLEPWESTYLDTNANQEYILSGTEKMMACILGYGGGVAVSGPVRDPSGISTATLTSNGRNWDCRLVLPTSSDQIGNPRSGFMSAPYSNTFIKYYRQTGTSGNLTVSPGSPVPISTYGGNLGDHNPSGYVRWRATGLATGYSGADGQGGDAVQFSDVGTLSQVVAQPLYMPDSGFGDETGIAIFSPYEGTAKVFEWNTTTKSLDLAYTLALLRDSSITINSKEDQLHPAAASLSNSINNTNNTLLTSPLNPGVVIADVPIGIVIQAQNGQVPDMRSQNETTTSSIYTQEDETASYGWTPATLKAEITEGTDGILYKRSITAGTETWTIA